MCSIRIVPLEYLKLMKLFIPLFMLS
ncbi:hypothetical protein OIU77_020727 [Salix suchowensis]|uniref:NADH dehydrogenase subunit 1 n=1 Tax=Salix suchowensis TaxID=1278906 RepID=A0ABQ9C7F4_9ROSI|nr:hypothetical protein OIU77_020727 [Salix suchowensis]